MAGGGEEAFRLFTPLGETLWAPEWDPRFLAPVVDDSAPGTVFEVEHGGATGTWMVCRCERWRLIQYARVIPARTAGTVTVTLEPDGADTVVTVEYHLTALSGAGRHELGELAAGYDEYLQGWESAIRDARRS